MGVSNHTFSGRKAWWVKTWKGAAGVVDTALNATAVVTDRVAAVAGTQDPVIATRAFKIAEAIKLGISVDTSDGRRFYTYKEPKIGDDRGDFRLDEDAMAEQLTTLAVDLSNADGTLNKNAALITDSELLSALIGIARAPSDGVSKRLVVASRNVLNQLIGRSSRDAGLFRKACPDALLEVLGSGQFSDDPVSHANQISRHHASIDLLRQVAAANPGQDLKIALRNYTDGLPKYFHGKVGEALKGLIQEEFDLVLSHPGSVLSDPDLVLDPDIRRDMGEAVSELFMSCVSRPYRNHHIVLAANNLIKAFEDEDRIGAGFNSVGVHSAREQFINAFSDELDSVMTGTQELKDLEALRQQVFIAIESGSKVHLKRELCTDLQKQQAVGTLLEIQPSGENLVLIDRAIHKAEEANARQRDAFYKGAVAAGKAFEKCASPYGEQVHGIKRLFFDRLLPEDIDAEALDAKGFLELMTDLSGEDIDFTKLDDSSYGCDFTGVKKVVVNHLKRRWMSIGEEISVIDRNLRSNAAREVAFNSEYSEPLGSFIPRTVPALNLAVLESGFKDFCGDSGVVERTMRELSHYNSMRARILNTLLISGADEKLMIDDSAISDLGLTDGVRDSLRIALESIADSINSRGEDSQITDADFNTPQVRVVFGIIDDSTFRSRIDLELEMKTDHKDVPAIVKLLGEESRKRTSCIDALAGLINYEYKIDKTPTKQTFTSKMPALGSRVGVSETKLQSLSYERLGTNLEASGTFMSRTKSMRLRKAVLERQLEKSHPDFDKAWELELSSGALKKGINFSSGMILNAMGMDANAGETLEANMGSYYDSYSLDDPMNSFQAIVKSLLQYVIQLIQEARKVPH